MSAEEVLNQNIVPVNLEEELKTAFLDYSMSVIVSRALPDVRDGLKPVHRRILYAMYHLRNFFNRPYLKSARVVGDVIGKYHPHGDSPVYEALVRMAQEFSMRYPLVDGQGNFGSIDGDMAAAMRYTEVRLDKLAQELLLDIEKDTVEFQPNYDNKEFEPTVLPSVLPQLLVNGASGIAVGMATNIPPHNLKEITFALDALIDNPSITIEELLQYVKGPDFPTAGIIYGVDGIRSAFMTGRGSILMRARAFCEDIPKNQQGRQRIVITELPYQVNKARLIEKIAELVTEKKIEGISDIRDESAQQDIRVVVELKRGEVADVVLNNLYKLTPMQSSFGVNFVALSKGAPKLLNLKEALEEFYYHRREVILRRTLFDLKKAEDKAHILLGLKIAVDNLDKVVATIRQSKDSASAQLELISQFSLSEPQAKAILEMRLSRLTGLERAKIVQEYEETLLVIADLKDILGKPERVTTLIKEELIKLRELYGDERKTEIVMSPADEITIESLIADEDVAVTITHTGYIKRTPLSDIRAQRRGGKGKMGMKTKDEDIVRDLFVTSNHQSLLCFTSLGRVFDLKVYRIPESNMGTKGKHLANLIRLSENEKVVSILPVKQFSEGHFVVTVTSEGFIKKTDLMAYSDIRISGIIGLKLEENESLVGAAITNGQNEILIATKLGKAIRFSEEEVRPMGRSTRGVTGIRFSEEGDQVIGLEVLKDNSTILNVCEKGYGKRSPLDEYRTQGRGGSGIYTIDLTDKNGPLVGISQVQETDQVVLMTSSGKVMRFMVNEVSVIGRRTQGVRLVSLEEGEKVMGFARIVQFEGEELI